MSQDSVRFLLVDDLGENLLALQALLRRDGLELLTARNGREALELLLVSDVALAIVDVQMPEMDGFELAELMRGTERTRRVPIIFLTAGSADERRRFRGYEAGAVDFLYKPIEPHVLRSKAEVFFELYRQRQEVARQRDELRKAAEENKRLLDEVREADRRKDEFLAVLAHELRNPLAPIRMGLEVLRLGGDDPETFDEMVTTMESQVRHMVRLIDDLLDVSRITQGKLELRTGLVDLRDIIQTAVAAVRPLIDEAGHELILDVPATPIPLDADSARLSQVVSNLLSNAARYTREGGRITLSAERTGSDVVLAVCDTGIGIPQAMLEKVFEMFAQVDRSLERSASGLGIGLHLVKRLVELHGGTVEARSDGPGTGSEFIVRLPLAIGPRQPTASDSGGTNDETGAGAARRVLVADDNRDAADTLARMLIAFGHEVRTVYDGRDAVATAETFRPDVCLLDIGMPNLNGYEACRMIRGQSWSEETLLVALTGWGQDEDRVRSAEAGFDRHLVKPVEPAELTRLLADPVPTPAGG